MMCGCTLFEQPFPLNIKLKSLQFSAFLFNLLLFPASRLVALQAWQAATAATGAHRVHRGATPRALGKS